MDDQAPYPLPEDPALADAARAIRDAGHWGWIVDDRWRLVYASDELRLSFGALVAYATFELGAFFFGPEAMRASERWRMGSNSTELNRLFLRSIDTQGRSGALPPPRFYRSPEPENSPLLQVIGGREGCTTQVHGDGDVGLAISE